MNEKREQAGRITGVAASEGVGGGPGFRSRRRRISKLLELGVGELSMSVPSIPRAKKIISEL